MKSGVTSARYKDIFDFYYLINENKLDKEKLLNCINILIVKNKDLKEDSLQEIQKRNEFVLSNKPYLRRLEKIFKTINNDQIKSMLENQA